MTYIPADIPTLQHYVYTVTVTITITIAVSFIINPGIALWGIGQTGAFFESEAEELGLLETFLFGSLIAAVDPVAVLAVFDEIKVSLVLLSFLSFPVAVLAVFNEIKASLPK